MRKNEFPEAIKRFGGDISLFSGTAAMVAEDAPLELKQLEAALESEDKDQIEMSAHTLRGMLATFADKGGAVSGLQEVEKTARQEDLTVAKSHLLQSKADIEQLIAEINAFVESNPAVQR